MMARYLEVAEAELDNNSTEHSLRAVVLGGRNWLHVGQVAGGVKAAILFSLMTPCKRLGVEPYAYLHDVLRAAAQPSQQGHLATGPHGLERNLRAQKPRRPAPAVEPFGRSPQLSEGSLTP